MKLFLRTTYAPIYSNVASLSAKKPYLFKLWKHIMTTQYKDYMTTLSDDEIYQNFVLEHAPFRYVKYVSMLSEKEGTTKFLMYQKETEKELLQLVNNIFGRLQQEVQIFTFDNDLDKLILQYIKHNIDINHLIQAKKQLKIDLSTFSNKINQSFISLLFLTGTEYEINNKTDLYSYILDKDNTTIKNIIEKELKALYAFFTNEKYQTLKSIYNI